MTENSNKYAAFLLNDQISHRITSVLMCAHSV